MKRLLRGASRAAPYLCFAFLPYGVVILNRATLPPVPEAPVAAGSRVLMSARRDVVAVAGFSADAAGKSPVDVSKDELKKRWKLRRSAFPRWYRAEFGSFAMRSDAGADEARWVCCAVEWSWNEVARHFGGVVPPGRVEVTAFAAWTEFRAYASVVGSEEAESYYDPGRREIVVCLEGRTRAQRLAAIVHEVTHAVQHAASGRIAATWAAEGLADYMASTILAQCGLTVEPDEDVVVREMEGRRLPLGALVKGEAALFKGRGATEAYAQAYSVVKYLIEEKGMTPAEIASWGPGVGEVRGLEKEWTAWLNRADD